MTTLSPSNEYFISTKHGPELTFSFSNLGAEDDVAYLRREIQSAFIQAVKNYPNYAKMMELINES